MHFIGDEQKIILSIPVRTACVHVCPKVQLRWPGLSGILGGMDGRLPDIAMPIAALAAACCIGLLLKKDKSVLKQSNFQSLTFIS